MWEEMLNNYLSNNSGVTKPWWDTDYSFAPLESITPSWDAPLEPPSSGTGDYFNLGTPGFGTGDASPLSGYDTNSLGGDWGDNYGYGFANGPTSPMPEESNWWNGLGNTASGGLKSALGSKWAAPVVLGLAGGLLQGSASQDESELLKKLREARSKGAQDYLGALQTGKTEAKSSFLQNLSGQKASLLNKLGRQTADSGGANPRRVMERFQRGANEGYGDFLLKLMQEKTPDPSIYMAMAEGNVPADSWWTGTKKGLASTLGTTAGTMAQYNLLNALRGV